MSQNEVQLVFTFHAIHFVSGPFEFKFLFFFGGGGGGGTIFRLLSEILETRSTIIPKSYNYFVKSRLK